MGCQTLPEDVPNLPSRKASETAALSCVRDRYRFDRRTREWKRRCELVAAFEDALGGRLSISKPTALKIEVAAELAVVAELTRSRYLRGAAVSPDDVVRTANQAMRAERLLGIDGEPKVAADSLDDYLRRNAETVA